MADIKGKIIDEIQRSENEIVRFTQQLIRLRSLPGNEGDIQRFIARKFRDMELDVDSWEPDPKEMSLHPAFHFSQSSMNYGGRPNVVGRLKGSGKGRSLLLNGHVDVVSPGLAKDWKYDPWGGTIHEGRIYGRGACDMKGGLAAMIMAVNCIRKASVSLKGDVFLESVVDEEEGLGNGTLACILRNYRADAAIVAEPTENKVDIIQRGSIWFRIHVTGKAAHHAFREKGVSAIEKMLIIHDSLLKFEKLRKKIRHPFLEDMFTLNVGLIRAGSWSGSVPSEAVLDGVFGYLPNEDVDTLKSQFLQWIEMSVNRDKWLRQNPPKVEIYYVNEAAEVKSSHSIVATMKKSFVDLGLRRGFKISALPSGCDMRLLNNYAQIPTVIFGPGSIKNAHSVDEFVPIDEITTCTKVIAMTMVNWCSK